MRLPVQANLSLQSELFYSLLRKIFPRRRPGCSHEDTVRAPRSHSFKWSTCGLVLLRLYALERPAQLEPLTLNFSPEVLYDTSLAVNKAVSAISASPSFLSLPLGVMSVALSSFLGSAHHNAYSSPRAGCHCSSFFSLISHAYELCLASILET
jgi:hypothetical protein